LERSHALHVDVYNVATEGVTALVGPCGTQFLHILEIKSLEPFGLCVVDILQESHMIALLFADMHN
jgi:hypothetical protein